MKENLVSDANKMTSTLFTGLTNMYVQNYSNITKIAKQAETIFTNLATSLGDNLESWNWTAVNTSISEMISLASEYNTEIKNTQAITTQLISKYVELGGKLSDIIDSASDGLKDIYDNTKTALTDASSYGELMSTLGKNVGDKFTEALTTSIMDTYLSSTVLDLYKQLESSTLN